MEGARWSLQEQKIVESQKKILYDQILRIFFSYDLLLLFLVKALKPVIFFLIGTFQRSGLSRLLLKTRKRQARQFITVPCTRRVRDGECFPRQAIPQTMFSLSIMLSKPIFV